MLNILENNFGSISISKKDLFLIVVHNLKKMFDFKLDISLIDFIISEDYHPIFQFLIKSTGDQITTYELNMINDAIEVILKSNLNLNIFDIELGVKYINE